MAILLPPPDPGWARGAAVTGFVGAGVVLVMTFAVMGANNGDESSGDSARALGIATTVTAAALGPIVAVGGGSARGNPAVVGYPVLRVVSWVGYVVTLLDALALIAISFESEVANSHIFSVGLLGSLSITGFALDALRSAQEAEALRASMRLSLRPAIGFVRDPRGDGRRPTLGLALRF